MAKTKKQKVYLVAFPYWTEFGDGDTVGMFTIKAANKVAAKHIARRLLKEELSLVNETLDCPESYHIDGTCPLMPGFSTVIQLPGRLRSVRHLDAARFGASTSRSG